MTSRGRLNILWVATKSPWPPVDGGRLLMLWTLEALRGEDCRVTLVAPANPEVGDPLEAAHELSKLCLPVLLSSVPRGRWDTLVGALTRRIPLSVSRHQLEPVRNAVERRLGEERFDLAVAEQLQALLQTLPAKRSGTPVILRSQNVESELWRASARGAGIFGPFIRREADRLGQWEGSMIRRCARVIALSARDGKRLEKLSGRTTPVSVVPVPFLEEMPSGPALPGEPAVVLLGSQGWRPNRQGARWFLKEVWPKVRTRLPQATLHIFGIESGSVPGPRVVFHPPPEQSIVAFPQGGIVVVPLRVASGVRMKILEAWARGLPVIATPDAAAGLEAKAGGELLIARNAQDFTEALAAIASLPALRQSLKDTARKMLRERHAPEKVAGMYVETFAEVAGRGN